MLKLGRRVAPFSDMLAEYSWTRVIGKEGVGEGNRRPICRVPALGVGPVCWVSGVLSV